MKTGKKSVVAEILTSLTRYFAALVIIVAAAILLSGIRMVKSGEVALIFRFGKLTGETYEEQVHGPGLMFAFPYVIDEVVTVPVGSVKKTDVTTHYTSGTMSAYTRNGYVVSGDKNIIMISASVQYSITDPVLYVLNVNDESKLINGIVSAKLISAAAAMSSDSLLTTGKLELADTVKKASQNELNSAQTGITIASLELTNVSMPQEVREIYDAVNSAKVQAETMTEQAKQYRETVITAAEATASSLVSGATATYRGRRKLSFRVPRDTRRIRKRRRRRQDPRLQRKDLRDTLEDRRDQIRRRRRNKDRHRRPGWKILTISGFQVLKNLPGTIFRRKTKDG